MERRFDDLGRIVIPMEIRKALEIEDNSYLYVNLDEDSIYLSKEHNPSWITKRIYGSGRISLPIEYKRMLSLSDSSRASIDIHNGMVRIRKSYSSCIMCGSYEGMKYVKGVRVCQSCIDEIKTSNYWEAC